MNFGYEQIVPTTTVFGVSPQAGLLDDVRAHEEVVEVEVGGTGLVGADAADVGGEVDHELGFECRRTCADDRAAVAQVVLAAARRHDTCRAAGAEPGEDGARRGSRRRR